jgi:hypothetical protein
MSYDIIGTDDEDYESMGCLACVVELFDNQIASEIEIDLKTHENFELYSGTTYGIGGDHGPALTWEWVLEAAKVVMSAMPEGAFKGQDMDKVHNGLITICSADSVEDVHTWLAPFRPFIERPYSLLFFKECMDLGYPVMGSFIAAHCVHKSYLCEGWITTPGWHQSAFSGVHLWNVTYFQSEYYTRKVVSLDPALRHHLTNRETISYRYRIADLYPPSYAKIAHALDETLPASAVTRLGYDIQLTPREIEKTVRNCQTWYDTIRDTLTTESKREAA